MSISNLLVPNDLDLYANSLTTTGPIIGNSFWRVDYTGSGTQTIPNATATAVSFATNLLQSNFPATLPTTTYTAPIGGLYLISYNIDLSNTTGVGYCQAYIKRASATSAYGVSSSRFFEASALTIGPPVSAITLGTDGIPLGGTAVIPLALNETFQLLVYQNSGTSQTLTNITPNISLISITFLHS